MIRRIHSQNLLDGSFTKKLPAGKIARIIVRVSGTNNTSYALAAADLGIFKVSHQGKEIGNVVPADLMEYKNLKGGTVEASSTTSGAFAFLFEFPFGLLHDPANVLETTEEDNLKTEITWDNLAATLATKVASGTIKISVEFNENGVAKYIPIIKNYSFTFAAANTISEVLPLRKIQEIYVNHNANISSVKLLRDGKSIVDADWATVNAVSDSDMRVETGTDFVHLLSSPNEALLEADSTELEFVTSGAVSPLRCMLFAYGKL